MLNKYGLSYFEGRWLILNQKVIDEMGYYNEWINEQVLGGCKEYE